MLVVVAGKDGKDCVVDCYSERSSPPPTRGLTAGSGRRGVELRCCRFDLEVDVSLDRRREVRAAGYEAGRRPAMPWDNLPGCRSSREVAMTASAA